MHENKLRWRGRIGALKSSLPGIALLAALALAILAMGPLSTALRNPGEPQAVSLSQLVSKEIGTGRYVTASGRGIFAAGITLSDDDGDLTGFIYPVADDDSGALLYVRSARYQVDAPKTDDEPVTITGIVRDMPGSAKALIERDMAAIEEAGFVTAPDVCLVEGQKPGKAGLLILLAALLGLVVLAGVVTLFFPYPVFGRRPVQAAGAPAGVDRGARATGRFQRLKRIDPAVEVGKGTRKFHEAAANILTLEDGRLMIYVRHVAKYGNTGITLSTTHWALFPEPQSVAEVEPGAVYGWRDRPAARLCLLDARGKAQDVVLSFGQSAAQTEFLELLRGKGFSVGTGA